MSYHVRRIRRESPKSKPRSIKTLQKPNGVISSRVQKVGGEHFAIVCVDPAKHRSAWMMADYFGNVLIEPQGLQHVGAGFKLAVEQIHQVQQKARHSRPHRRRRADWKLLSAREASLCRCRF